MDEATYAKLYNDFVVSLKSAKNNPQAFLPTLEEFRRRFLAAESKLTNEDVQRARSIESSELSREFFINNRFFANNIRTLGDIADKTEKQLTIILWHNEVAIAKVKAVLTKYKLKLRR